MKRYGILNAKERGMTYVFILWPDHPSRPLYFPYSYTL